MDFEYSLVPWPRCQLKYLALPATNTKRAFQFLPGVLQLLAYIRFFRFIVNISFFTFFSKLENIIATYIWKIREQPVKNVGAYFVLYLAMFIRWLILTPVWRQQIKPKKLSHLIIFEFVPTKSRYDKAGL